MSPATLVAPPLPQRIHCVGIAGGGLSALAAMLAARGHVVSGSDCQTSPATDALARRGVRVERGHRPEHADGAELVIRSAAVREDNPEVAAARARAVPVVKYSEAVGRLMAGRLGVAVAGTHGKTTTTALVAHLLAAAGADPGWIVGGHPRTLPGAAAWGGEARALVVEACEYDDSFLNLEYRVAAVLGVAADHLDWFGDERGVRAAFTRFAARVPEGGVLVLGRGVPADLVLAPAPGALLWRAHERLRQVGVVEDERGFSGTLDGGPWGRGAFRLPLLGRHNLGNLEVALAVCVAAGVPLPELLPHVASFTGVRRRLEVLDGPGAQAASAVIIDDFAHHPDELRAAIEAVRARFGGRRVVGVFQPHQVCRTEHMLEDFAAAACGLDALLLCDVFVARDARPERAATVTDELLAAVRRRAAAGGAPALRPEAAVRIGPARGAAGSVAARLAPGDVCLVMGAGDIDGLAAELARSARP